MRKIITFLGTKPLETVYEWQGKTYPGRVFAEALREFVDFDKMLVLTTEAAKTTTWPLLAVLDDSRIQMVPIPDGKDTDGMWGIFQAVIAEVEEGETVIFDITHGFRSLPFLAFLFAAYLKTAKKVKIEAIYYGAYDMAPQNNGKAPVIDLSQFVEMLDWMTATDQFVQTGNAKSLAELLNKQGQESGALKDAESALSLVSQAAFLCQPFILFEAVHALPQRLDNAQAELPRQFEPLQKPILSAFSQFSLPKNPGDTQKAAAELKLIVWYVNNKQVVQAFTLAKEWLVDAVTIRMGKPLNFKQQAREEMDKAVSGLVRVGHFKIKDKETGKNRLTELRDINLPGQQIYTTWPEKDKLIEIWNKLELRNKLNHAGHQTTKIDTHVVQKQAEEVLTDLQKLATEWQLV